MRARCNNPGHPQYSDYGGRGITICDRWNDFSLFVEDMGERPDGHTLDRKENDGNYEPSNCCWATKPQQQRNRRYCFPDNNPMVCIRPTPDGFRVSMQLRPRPEAPQHHKHFPNVELATDYRDLLLYEREFYRALTK